MNTDRANTRHHVPWIIAALVLCGLAQNVHAQTLGMCCRAGDPWSCWEDAPLGSCPPGYVWSELNDCNECEHGDPWGGCCDACTGQCDHISHADCDLRGGTWYYLGDYVSCYPNCEAGPPEPQACCFSDDSCSDLEPQYCVAGGGAPQGPGTDCGSVICGSGPEPRTCCLDNGECVVTLQEDCALMGGTWDPASNECHGDSDDNGYDDACDEEGKWVQAPDLSMSGTDVFDTQVIMLADDFRCNESTLITHITIWGSWLSDQLPVGGANTVRFTVSIHRTNVDTPHEPGNVVWTQTFSSSPEDLPFTSSQHATGISEGFFDPASGAYSFPADSICWQYDFDIPPEMAFCQKGDIANPVVYWLSAQATLIIPGSATFGWKTTNRDWGYSAHWAEGVAPFGNDWLAMSFPIGHPAAGSPLNLAFAIQGSQTCTYCVPCCLPDGMCEEMPREDCWMAGGDTRLPDYYCSDIECPQPPEACCFPDGSCEELDPEECSSLGGYPQGPGMDCTSIECPVETEACCFPDGMCEEWMAEDCILEGGIPQGYGSDCWSVQCPQPDEACCLPDGTCVDTTTDECSMQGGISQGYETDCSTTECPQPDEACCLPDGSCVDTTADDCVLQEGTPQGYDTECATVECPDPCEGIPLGDFVAPAGVDGLDIQPFVLALLSETPTQDQICRGDFNDNDMLDIGDLDGMVTLLLAIPE